MARRAIYKSPFTGESHAVEIVGEPKAEDTEVRIRFINGRPAGMSEEVWMPRIYLRKVK